MRQSDLDRLARALRAADPYPEGTAGLGRAETLMRGTWLLTVDAIVAELNTVKGFNAAKFRNAVNG